MMQLPSKKSRSMRMISLTAVGVLALAACGSDDGGGGDNGANDRLYDELVASFSEDGSTQGLDEGCLRDAVNDVPSDQAAILADNIDAVDAPEGVDPETLVALTDALFECIDIGALLEE